MKHVKHGCILGACIILTVLAVSARDVSSPLLQAPTKATLHIPPFASPSFSVGWVGDMVPTLTDTYNRSALAYVQGLTSTPTLMIGNLEGTFAYSSIGSKCAVIMTKCHAFRGTPSFAFALKTAGFDFVSLVNNHSYDFGDKGLLDTELVLQQVGIPYISPTKPTANIEVQGKKIGIIGVSSTPPFSTITDYDFISREVALLKHTNDIVILIFHGGSEGSDKTAVTGEYEYLGTENRGNVQEVAYTAIDAGADMVLGAGPHVLRKVEYYRNKPIIYSAGNFVGGNGNLLTKGILSLSALFMINVQNEQFTHSVTSLLLSPNGVPSMDVTEQAKSLIENLSK